MGFFSGSGGGLNDAIDTMGLYGNRALGNIQQGYDQGIGTLSGLQQQYQPGFQEYLRWAQQGGGAEQLQGLQQQMQNYSGPDLANDPYTQARLDNATRDTRMAQAARGGIGAMSSAGIGQEARLRNDIYGQGYQDRRGFDMNRMGQAFGMQQGVNQQMGNSLGALGNQYAGLTGNMAGMQVDRGNAMGAANQWTGGQMAGLQAQKQDGPSFLDKIGMVSQGAGALGSMATSVMSPMSQGMDLMNQFRSMPAMKNIYGALGSMNQDELVGMMGGGGGYR